LPSASYLTHRNCYRAHRTIPIFKMPSLKNRINHMQETTKNKQIKSFALRTISCTNNRPWIRKERAIEIKISLTG
jgi:hypothetical protein